MNIFEICIISCKESQDNRINKHQVRLQEDVKVIDVPEYPWCTCLISVLESYHIWLKVEELEDKLVEENTTQKGLELFEFYVPVIAEDFSYVAYRVKSHFVKQVEGR